jgi:hypothetical protein
MGLGALVATSGDRLHVVYGVLFYPRSPLLEQPWWVFPLFLGATGAMLAGVDAVRRRLSGEALPTSPGEALLATAAFFVAYAFTAVASELPSFVLVVLVLAWLLRVRGMPRWVVVYALGVAACGVAFEALLSCIGAFAYVSPDWLGVPRWLPGLYLHAALAPPRIRGLL